MKTLTIDELKKESDSLGLTLRRNTRDTLVLSTNIKLEKPNEQLELIFHYCSNSMDFEDKYSLTGYIFNNVNNYYGQSDYYKNRPIKHLQWEDKESLKDYLDRVQKQINDLLSRISLNSKKKVINGKKWEIDNEDVIGKFKTLAESHKNCHFEDKTPTGSSAHQFQFYNGAKGSYSWTESLNLYERPKLKKWEIRNQWMCKAKITVDTFEEAYNIVEWWMNKPKCDIGWR